MQCERCGNAEAIVHLTATAGNALTQRHLCRACAEAEGHHLPPPRDPAEWTVLNILNRDQAS